MTWEAPPASHFHFYIMMTQYVGKSGQRTLLWLEQKTQPHSALRIAAWLLSDTISCLLIETINENLIVTLTRILIDWPTDEVHWLDYKASLSDRLPDHGLADLAECLNSVERERSGRVRLLLLFLFPALPTVSEKRKHPDGWGERLKEEADATGGRRRRARRWRRESKRKESQ